MMFGIISFERDRIEITELHSEILTVKDIDAYGLLNNDDQLMKKNKFTY